MAIQELDEALHLAPRHPSTRFVGDQPDDRILAAERALGCSFPPTYRRFLSRAGCGSIGSDEIFGLASDDLFAVGTVVAMTKDHQQAGFAPDAIIFISDIGDGRFYCLDLRGIVKGQEAPVVVWNPGLTRADEKVEVVASDFGTFALELIQTQLDGAKE